VTHRHSPGFDAKPKPHLLGTSPTLATRLTEKFWLQAVVGTKNLGAY
jgi:hypothetical protein